jgi:hypothetical protein
MLALKLADIWAYAEILKYAEWRTIAIVSELSQAIEILRAEGFEVIEESNSAVFPN